MSLRVAQNSRRRPRGAALYPLVLSVTLIVSLLALSGLTLLRIERRTADRKYALEKARRYAQAAIEIGMLRIQTDPNWRTNYSHGVWEANRTISDGTYTLEGLDTVDTDLADCELDPVLVIGTGMVGSVTQKLQVTMTPDTKGLSCVETALHAGVDVTLGDGVVTCDQKISSNNNVDNTGATVNSDVEAVNFISGTYGGTTTAGVTARTMPDVNMVFDHYITSGTTISISSLPLQGAFRKLERLVLSPGNNPYGATDPQGVYVIDCQFQAIHIQDLRIVGTICLLDPASNSRIQGSIRWEPAVSNYPALLVRGEIDIRCDGNPLDEAALNVNFNPAHTPYEAVADVDIADLYPNEIDWLVYASQSLALNGGPTYKGVVICGSTASRVTVGTVTLNYRSTYLTNAPPGFRTGEMVVSPGSWAQRVD